MAFNIDRFAAATGAEFARPSLFEVTMVNPAIRGLGDNQIRFLAKVANLPASTLGVVEVPYFGRKMKIAGDRTYEPWNITIINDENFIVRGALENWSNQINESIENTRRLPAGPNGSTVGYRSTATVKQFAVGGGPALRTYTMQNCWPKTLSAIELAWDTVDAIEEYQVEWEFDYWTATGEGGTIGNPGSSLFGTVI
jgi:hypothetical protein